MKKLILHENVPPNSVHFEMLFAEFRRAHPINPSALIGEWGAAPGARTLDAETKQALAVELGFLDEEFMYDAFLDVLEELDPASIVLAHRDHGFLRVSPRLLSWAELIPATFGHFVIPEHKAPLWPIARTHNGAQIYVPKPVADALRALLPANPASPDLAPKTPEMPDGKERQTGTTAVVMRAAKEILAAFKNGKIRTQKQASDLVSMKYNSRPLKRACEEAQRRYYEETGQDMWRRGNPGRSGK